MARGELEKGLVVLARRPLQAQLEELPHAGRDVVLDIEGPAVGLLVNHLGEILDLLGGAEIEGSRMRFTCVTNSL